MRRPAAGAGLAMVYIGAVVGAGFASGQEVVQFFLAFGRWGLAGIALSSLLFAVAGTKLIGVAHRLRSASHREILVSVCGPALGPLLDRLLTAFLWVSLVIMFSAAGSISADHARLPGDLGRLALAAATFLTVAFGGRGLLALNQVLVPAIAASTVFLGVLALAAAPQGSPGYAAGLRAAFSPHWLASTVLYASYNMAIALAAFGPLGRYVRDRKAALQGGLVGALGIALLLALEAVALLRSDPIVLRSEIPMLSAARGLHGHTGWAYGGVLLVAILTTAAAAASGVSARLAQATGWRSVWTGLLVVGSAVPLSQFRFSDLVKVIYPIFGYLGGIFLLMLLLSGTFYGPTPLRPGVQARRPPPRPAGHRAGRVG